MGPTPLAVFSGMLQLLCKFRYCHKMWSVSLSVFLSVRQVYCDKMAEARIMQFSLNVAQCLNSLPAMPSLITKFEEGPLNQGTQTGVGWYLIEFATLYLRNSAI